LQGRHVRAANVPDSEGMGVMAWDDDFVFIDKALNRIIDQE
jgi:hypothetical protein